nr:hypothetical protein Iba_chr11dCG7900 [Ipomoea batatas]
MKVQEVNIGQAQRPLEINHDIDQHFCVTQSDISLTKRSIICSQYAVSAFRIDGVQVAVLAPKQMSSETSQDLFLEEYISNPIATSKPVASKAQMSLYSDATSSLSPFRPWQHNSPFDEALMTTGSGRKLKDGSRTPADVGSIAMNLNSDLAGRNGRTLSLMTPLRPSSLFDAEGRSIVATDSISTD